MARPFKDLIGQTFGRLSVIEKTDHRYFGDVIWICKCDCGTIVEQPSRRLKSGDSKSCGCLYREVTKNKKGKNNPNYKHGLRSHSIYTIWYDMKRRCLNPSRPDYKYYGGRGIKVCDRWLKFELFCEDMFSTWKDGLTLERISNDGNYEPNNCKWVTWKEQQKNKRPRKGKYIYFHKNLNSKKKYRVNIKGTHVGMFETEKEAAKAVGDFLNA